MVAGRTRVGANSGMELIVGTERLGVPGEESGGLERLGYVQKSLEYPHRPDEPTATCHIQPGQNQRALCSYQWEGLIAIPGATSLADVPEALRCTHCLRLAVDLSG
jgi:hypothetical protein